MEHRLKKRKGTFFVTFIKLFIAALLLPLCLSAQSPERKTSHLAYGNPGKADTIVERPGYALGYTKLLEESAHLLNDLKSVVNENGLSMSDKDRMDIIDKCYSEMLQYRGLVQYYTNKNIGVSYLRAKKQNDVDRVMSLYGSPSERYW